MKILIAIIVLSHHSLASADSVGTVLPLPNRPKLTSITQTGEKSRKRDFKDKYTLTKLGKKYSFAYPHFEFKSKGGVEVEKRSFSSVSDFFFQIRKFFKPTVFLVAGKRVVIGYREIVIDKKTLIDSRQIIEELEEENLDLIKENPNSNNRLKSVESSRKPNKISAIYERPLSLVGPVLTLESVFDCACGGGPPGSIAELKSFDIHTDGLVEPEKYFYKDSLLDALKSETCIKESISPDSLSKAEDLLTLNYALRNSAHSHCNGILNLNAFSIVDFDANRNLATIRLSFQDNLSASHVTSSFINLLVKPKEDFRTGLLQAQKGKGFFQKDADKIFSFSNQN